MLLKMVKGSNKRYTKDNMCCFEEFKIGYSERINLKDILDVEYYIIEEGE